MKSMIYVTLMFFAIACLSGCRESTPETPPDQSRAESTVSNPNVPDPKATPIPDGLAIPDHSSIMTIVGKVVHKNLEGGFFAIDGEDGKKYNPIGLPQDFQKDGLKVKVKARLMPDAMSIHMYGAIIQVLDITAQ